MISIIFGGIGFNRFAILFRPIALVAQEYLLGVIDYLLFVPYWIGSASLRKFIAQKLALLNLIKRLVKSSNHTDERAKSNSYTHPTSSNQCKGYYYQDKTNRVRSHKPRTLLAYVLAQRRTDTISRHEANHRYTGQQTAASAAARTTARAARSAAASTSKELDICQK